jgi:hypothetical protein
MLHRLGWDPAPRLRPRFDRVLWYVFLGLLVVGLIVVGVLSVSYLQMPP